MGKPNTMLSQWLREALESWKLYYSNGTSGVHTQTGRLLNHLGHVSLYVYIGGLYDAVGSTSMFLLPIVGVIDADVVDDVPQSPVHCLQNEGLQPSKGLERNFKVGRQVLDRVMPCGML